MRAAVLLIVLTVSGAAARDGSSISPPMVTRAVATLNGVFSPRGFFNIIVRLNQLHGAESAKLDLKKSRITVDFSPGVTVTEAEMESAIHAAGYRPGPIRVELLKPDEAVQTGPGWVRLKHPSAKNPVARWLQLNF